MMTAKKSIDGLTTRSQKAANQARYIKKNNQLGKKRTTSRKISVAGEKPVRRIAVSEEPRSKCSISIADEGDYNDILETKQSRHRAHEDFLEPIQTFDINSDEIDEELSKKDRKKLNKQAKKEAKKAKKKAHKKRRIIFCVLAILLIGALVGGILWIHFKISDITGGTSGIFDIWKDGAELQADANGRTNILIFGTSGYEMSGSGHDGAQLTDSIMVVSLDQNEDDIVTISLPRDLKVTGACSAGKINEVYWCNNKSANDEAAGAEALEKQVTAVLGLDFQYYVHVDWGALVQVVDALGGITVTLDEDINDTAYTGTKIKAGVATTLTGEQALGLARARHGTSGGDFSRGNSQQKILLAIQQKAVEQGIDITSAFNIFNALGDNIRTNLAVDEMKTIYHIGMRIDMDTALRSVSLYDADEGINYFKTATISNISYVIPTAGDGKFSAIQDYVKTQINSDPAARENAQIMILNGTGEAGVAASEQEKLESEGLTVAEIGDAPKGTYSGYQVYAITSDKTATSEKLAEFYSTELKSASDLPSDIDATDYDFVIIIGTKE